MLNSVVFDVVIGMIFIYLLYSLLATVIQEIIANKLAFRSKVLEKAIIRMLEDGASVSKYKLFERVMGFVHLLGKFNLLKKANTTIAPWFYAHPLIKYLAEDNFYSKPAYITPQNFSKVMIDLLKGFGNNNTSEVQSISDSISNGTIYQLPIDIKNDKSNPAISAILQNKNNNTVLNANETVKINNDTALFLRSIWQESAGDIEQFKSKLEQWFNDTMDRATGWYKRYTQYLLFVIGVIVAITFNVDSIAIYKILAKDKTARGQLVQLAANNENKYSGIISEINRNNVNDSKTKNSIDSSVHITDSVLNATYHLVNKDIEASNDILGLGRPWSDSLKMYDDVNTKIINLNGELLSVNSRLSNKLSPSDSIKNVDLKNSLNKFALLQVRCDFILSEKKNKCFKFSVRQAGGIETVLGWLLTAIAISLGAPFWFDLLNKMMKLRSSGTKEETPNSSITTDGKQNTQAINIQLNNLKDEAVG